MSNPHISFQAKSNGKPKSSSFFENLLAVCGIEVNLFNHALWQVGNVVDDVGDIVLISVFFKFIVVSNHHWNERTFDSFTFLVLWWTILESLHILRIV
jgi:hypothetical protein